MVSSALQVGEFASKAFVQRALKNPSTLSAVISFYYGVDYESKNGLEELQKGSCIQTMKGLWYGGGPEYDRLCAPFASLVRQAGRGELVEPSWQGSVDGVISQLLLCDQLSRNIFRGTPEAFAYDEESLKHARTLTSAVLGTTNNNKDAPTLTGDVYPPYLANMVTALMHSEQVQDHEYAMSLLDYAKQSTPSSLLQIWEETTRFEQEHKDIIDTFGRYPHRNAAKGRESTPEENAWLADVDNLPAWALSQLSKATKE